MDLQNCTLSAVVGTSVILVTAVGAQEPTVPISGRVVDTRQQPIPGVLVFVGDDSRPSTWTRTGDDGHFRLDSVTAGTHRVSFRKGGFAPRSLDHRASVAGDSEVGAVTLRPGLEPVATLLGTVTDADGGPVAGAHVELNGETRVVSNDVGGFRFDRTPVAWGTNELAVRHPWYGETTDEVWIAEPDRKIPLNLVLRPAGPEAGSGVAGGARATAEAAPIPGFRERERSTDGYFIERTEIEQNDPASILDVLRSVPGLRTSAGPDGVEIRFTRQAGSVDPSGPEASGCSSPILYVDGVRTGGGGSRFVGIEGLVKLEDVAGIEAYDGASRIPRSFDATGSSCGVIAIWTVGSLLDPSTLVAPAGPQLGPELGEDDGLFLGVSLEELAIGSAVVGGVAILFWKTLCAQPHFCQ